MSDERTISGYDINNDRWEARRRPDTLYAGTIAEIELGGDSIWLNAGDCSKLASFLLAAIGPDAAHEALAKLMPDVIEAAERYAKAEELSVEQTRLALAHRDKRIAAESRAERAEKRLAAVLALTGEDLDRAYDAELLDGIIDLIRSRATEGAEAPTGATT